MRPWENEVEWISVGLYFKCWFVREGYKNIISDKACFGIVIVIVILIHDLYATTTRTFTVIPRQQTNRI